MARINWLRAFQDYITHTELSYVDIAKKYGVSKPAVEKRAKKEQWVAARQEVMEKLRQELPQKTGESMSEVAAKHVDIAKLLQSKGLEAIVENVAPIKTARDAREYVEGGVEMERKARGMDEKDSQTNNIIFVAPDWFKPQNPIPGLVTESQLKKEKDEAIEGEVVNDS